MKLRIKSHSIRFRLSEEDLAQLNSAGEIMTQVHIPGNDGVALFTFGVRHVAQVGESQLVSDGAGMRLELSTADLQHLNNPAEEGVYLRRNWTSDSGREIRFVAYVEIDKKKDKHKHPSRPETKTGEIQPSASKIEQTRECLVIIDESGSGHSSPRENTP